MRIEASADHADHELSLAQEDLAEAEASFGRARYRWSTVQSYYAMFHAARALLYLLGYREKSHRCLMIALRELLVQQGRLEEGHLIDFQDAKALREEADYRGSFTETGAGETLKSAMKFIDKVSDLLIHHG